MSPRDDAWIYARRSRASQDQASVQDQEERGREACDEHGWPVRGVLFEEVSASRYARKPRNDWPELLDKIGAGLVGILLLWQSSRGDRKLSEWAEFLELCVAHSVRIYIMADERLYNPANKADWKTLASQGVDNDYFSRNLSVEVAKGKRGAMRKGRHQGIAPYGYEVHYNEATGKTAGWRIIPDRADIAREIILGIGRARPAGKIIASLNERGIPSATGRQWTRSSIKRIASNPAYAGLVRLGDGTYAQRQPQKDGAQWPPIVTRAEWEAACAVLTSRATGPRPGAARHLLSGIARCECGGLLRGGSSGRGYQCRSGSDIHVMLEPLNAWVRDVICETLSLPDARDVFLRDDSPRLAIVQGELRELTGRRSKFRKQAALDIITADALAEIEATIAAEIGRREREIAAVQPRVPVLAEAIAAADVREWWDRQEVQALRELIAAVTGITVAKVPRTAGIARRFDWQARVAFDWKPQPPKRGPGGRLPA